MDNHSFQRLSISIENLRFPLILLIIMLHCYTSTVFQIPGHIYYFRVVYPFALWLGETGVPAYFFISGLLLFYSKKTYEQKIRDRIHTLLVPYFFFNAVILIGHLIPMLLGKPAMILGKDLSDYSFVDYIRAFWDRGDWAGGNGAPLLCPFWYIRNLMMLVILSPIIYYIIKYTKLLLPLITGFLWINAFDSAYLLESITMFSIGAYFPICGRNPIVFFEQYKVLFLSMFSCLFFADIAHTIIHVPHFQQIHRLSLVANVFFILWIGERLSKHHLYSAYLSKSAFFVFCIHYPLVLPLKTLFSRASSMPDIILIGLYVAGVVTVAVSSIIIYMILHKFFPKFIHLITGSRG